MFISAPYTKFGYNSSSTVCNTDFTIAENSVTLTANPFFKRYTIPVQGTATYSTDGGEPETINVSGTVSLSKSFFGGGDFYFLNLNRFFLSGLPRFCESNFAVSSEIEPDNND